MAAMVWVGLPVGAWAQDIPVTRISQIYGMAADPFGEPLLYLATERGFFAARPDGMAERMSPGTHSFTGFAADPNRPGAFVAAGNATGGAGNTIIFSDDFGRSWEALDAPEFPSAFLALDIFDRDSNVMVGVSDTLYRSADGGLTWVSAGAVPGPVADLAMSPTRPDTMFAATTGGLFVTEDGSQTWRAALAEGKPCSLVETLADGRAYAFVIGEGLYVGGDSGQAWSLVAPADNFDGALLHLAADFGGNLFAVTQFVKLLVSDDGGRTWRPFNS